ncbi:MAG: HAD family hydrolase [Candidatus Gastranaerophilaceae bacterium]|jgi:phosphoglycolate phosphatase/pyrophosphatase PpaX
MNKFAYIFDLDGTLGDTLPLCIFSFQEALEKLSGKRPSQEEVMGYFGYTEEGITKSMYPQNWQHYYDTYLEIYTQNHDICPEPFEGIIGILEYLKESGHKMALVTGKGQPSAEITLTKFKIKHYFEYIETGSPIKSIKPECIKKIIQKWDIDPEKIYYVGDSHTDIIDSKTAGVNPIAVSWASTANYQKLVEQNPHLIFTKIEDFKNWIESAEIH